MEWRDEGVILAVRRHGETSAIAELLTAEHGRCLGLVRGGRSRILEFTIALPSRCTVRTKSDELLAIGKRCLAQWGMINV